MLQVVRTLPDSDGIYYYFLNKERKKKTSHTSDNCNCQEMNFQGQTFPDRHLTLKRLDYKLSIYFDENFLKYTKKTFEDQCTRSVI